MKSVLDRIHFKERLSFETAALSKKSVQLSGSFDRGIRIDASTVANSSWLRAILWAFLLALREQTIDSLGRNPFPLAVLDDPQVTFDPRNIRKWALRYRCGAFMSLAAESLERQRAGPYAMRAGSISSSRRNCCTVGAGRPWGTVTVSGRASTLTSASRLQASQVAVTARTPFSRMLARVIGGPGLLRMACARLVEDEV
jgi:hypothetical protein